MTTSAARRREGTFLNTKLARPHVRSPYQPVLRAGTWHKDGIVRRSTVQRSTRRAPETHSVISYPEFPVYSPVLGVCTVLQALPVCRSGTTCVTNSKFPVYSPVAGVPYFRHCLFAGREPLCCGRSVYCSTLIQRRIIVDFGSGGVRDPHSSLHSPPANRSRQSLVHVDRCKHRTL